ncbi:MAG: hypothetical protein EHM67_08475 [Hyphomicrobiaceae bacterium]|nr:MAG: hypothetical protein EHM67_08475 [Hyphomicrobiaceae bacterium]
MCVDRLGIAHEKTLPWLTQKVHELPPLGIGDKHPCFGDLGISTGYFTAECRKIFLQHSRRGGQGRAQRNMSLQQRVDGAQHRTCAVEKICVLPLARVARDIEHGEHNDEV